MKKAMCALSAVLALCGALVLGPASQARAECTTQGALALALAEMLKLNVTTTEAASAALAALGIEPDGGWRLEECLTPDVISQIRTSYAAAVANSGHSPNLTTGAIDAALEAIRPGDGGYDVSPSRSRQ